MATITTIVIPRGNIRNHYTLSLGRRGGPLRHRAAPRGGQRNVHRDLLDEFYDDIDVEHDTDLDFSRDPG